MNNATQQAAAKCCKELEELLGFLSQYPHQYRADISGYEDACHKALAAYKKARQRKPRLKKALYIWNWADGGYYSTYAHSRFEAIRKALKIWPGHRPALATLKRLSPGAERAYWASRPLFPLFD